MNPTIILFSISFLGVLIMLGIRKYELKKGKTMFPASCRFCLDDFFTKIRFAILEIIARIKKLVIEKWSVIPHRISLFLSRVWSKLRAKIDKYFERFHRNHISGKRGPISQYWKSVHDHKDSLPK